MYEHGLKDTGFNKKYSILWSVDLLALNCDDCDDDNTRGGLV